MTSDTHPASPPLGFIRLTGTGFPSQPGGRRRARDSPPGSFKLARAERRWAICLATEPLVSTSTPCARSPMHQIEPGQWERPIEIIHSFTDRIKKAWQRWIGTKSGPSRGSLIWGFPQINNLERTRGAACPLPTTRHLAATSIEGSNVANDECANDSERGSQEGAAVERIRIDRGQEGGQSVGSRRRLRPLAQQLRSPAATRSLP